LDRTVRGPLADAALRMQQLAITTPPNGKLARISHRSSASGLRISD
jgi:hypothetical protein